MVIGLVERIFFVLVLLIKMSLFGKVCVEFVVDVSGVLMVVVMLNLLFEFFELSIDKLKLVFCFVIFFC